MTQHDVASGMGLHCLPMTFYRFGLDSLTYKAKRQNSAQTSGNWTCLLLTCLLFEGDCVNEHL